MANNSESLYDKKTALPNKRLNEDDSVTDLLGQAVSDPVNVYKTKLAIPNKFLNADGTITTLDEILSGIVDTDIFVIVDELPQEGNPQKIYLVPDGQGGFMEYHWTGTAWDPIGSIDFDPTQYYTITQTDSNFLKKDNTTAYTPTANYHPATKKYVDDSVLRQVICWDGNTTDYTFWNNLKTISTEVVIYANSIAGTTLQFETGPFVPSTVITPDSSGKANIDFKSSFPKVITVSTQGYSESYTKQMRVPLIFNQEGVVTSIDNIVESDANVSYFISPIASYSIPFTPTSNGHPATKKYVDDAITTNITNVLGGSY